MTNNQYTALSAYYQKIIFEQGYLKWIDYIFSVVEQNAPIKNGLDVGCGTGIFTRKLKEQGYFIIGVDNSQEMLALAKNYSTEQKLNIEYQKQDMRSLKTLKKVGFISVINDGLNYIPQKDLLKTFKSFYNCLTVGGALIFDISTEYKLKNVLGSNAFGDDAKELTYLWLNSYDENRRAVDINLSFFEKKGEVYIRHDEEQTQYSHSKNEITSALLSVGFTVKSITDENGNIYCNDSMKMLVVAVKN